MSDNNALLLQSAAALMNDLNVRYMEADLDGQLDLKPEMDQAFLNYSQARLALLENSIQCTPADVSQMQQLRQQVSQAAEIQTVIAAVIRFSSFLRGRFL